MSNKTKISEWNHTGNYTREQVKCIAISPLYHDYYTPAFLVVPNSDDGTVSCSTFYSDGNTHVLGYNDGDIVVRTKKDNVLYHEKIFYMSGKVYSFGYKIDRMLGSKKEDSIKKLSIHKSKITALRFSSQGLLYSSDETGTTYVWQPNSENKGTWMPYKLPIKEPVSAITTSNDGTLVAFQDTPKKEIEILDWNSITHKTINIPGTLIAITPANNILVGDIDSASLSLFSLKENRVIRSSALPIKTTHVYPNSVPLPETALFLKLKKKEQSEERNMIVKMVIYRDVAVTVTNGIGKK